MGWRDGIPVAKSTAAYTKGERIDNPAEDFKTTLQFGGLDTGVELPVGVSQALAGVGSGLSDIALGAMQRVGLAGEKDAAEKKRLDIPLAGTTPGMVGQIVGQAAPFIAGSVLLPGSQSLMGTALLGASEGAVQGALMPTVQGEDALQNSLMGGMVGGMAGMGAKALSSVIKPTKGIVDPGLAEKAKKLGFGVRIGEATGAKNIQNIEDVMRFLPFTGAKEYAFDEANAKILNKIVAKGMGADIAKLDKARGKLTNEVIEDAYNNLSNKFNRLTRMTKTIDATKPEFTSAIQQAKSELNLIAPQVRDSLGEVSKWLEVADDWAKQGTIDAKVYQVNRSMLSKAVKDAYTSGRSQVATVLDNVLDAMDSAAPDTAGWNALRKQWATYKMIEKNRNLIDNFGWVNPKQLDSSLFAANKKLYTQGKFGELGDAAAVAEAYLKSPNSATAQRSFWLNVLSNPLMLGGAAGAGVGGFSGGPNGGWDPYRAMAGAAVGAATPATIQGILHSPIGQAYIKHGILGGAGDYAYPMLANTLPAFSVADFFQKQ